MFVLYKIPVDVFVYIGAKGLCESSGLVQNGDTQLENNSPSKIEFIKNWGISTYKCTRQLMYEKLGKTSRTVDSGGILLYDIIPKVFLFHVHIEKLVSVL